MDKKVLQELLKKRLAVVKETTDKNFLEDYFGQLASAWQSGIPDENARYYADLFVSATDEHFGLFFKRCTADDR